MPSTRICDRQPSERSKVSTCWRGSVCYTDTRHQCSAAKLQERTHTRSSAITCSCNHGGARHSARSLQSLQNGGQRPLAAPNDNVDAVHVLGCLQLLQVGSVLSDDNIEGDMRLADATGSGQQTISVRAWWRRLTLCCTRQRRQYDIPLPFDGSDRAKANGKESVNDFETGREVLCGGAARHDRGGLPRRNVCSPLLDVTTIQTKHQPSLVCVAATIVNEQGREGSVSTPLMETAPLAHRRGAHRTS